MHTSFIHFLLIIMTENHITAQRIADILTVKNIAHDQKRMFGGDCFMVDDKMLIGTYKGGLMARVDPADESTFTNRIGVEAMIHGGRPMPGYLFIDPLAYESDADLQFWVEKCLDFNPKAKASGKKKTAK